MPADPIAEMCDWESHVQVMPKPVASGKVALRRRREIRVGCATRALGRRPMADQTTSEIVTYFRVCDGTRVRYADTKAESDTVILMLAPWPETL